MSFAREKHIRYWRMCTQNLPDHYIGNDSNRMTLGFFISSALDLLNALDSIDLKERESWVSWIYSCQVSTGGFRGFTGTNFGDRESKENAHWDPATVPSTFFALATLLVLGDDLSQVDRAACFAWLPNLQRENGCFGDLLGKGGVIEGDDDLRQCCCAAGIAYILKDSATVQPPFNVESLVHYIRGCQSWNGGFGVSPFKEPHSGLSYCAAAALSFVQRLEVAHEPRDVTLLIPDGSLCLRWLLERQTHLIDNENDMEEEEQERESWHMSQIAGFNGREGKIADTCYAFWNTGALAILNKDHLVDSSGMKKYLLEITQHRIGGFGKGKGDPPDVLHAYLGLAALAVVGQPDIRKLEPTLCMSEAAAARLEQLPWKRRDPIAA